MQRCSFYLQAEMIIIHLLIMSITPKPSLAGILLCMLWAWGVE
jgi:hypothetical protein